MFKLYQRMHIKGKPLPASMPNKRVIVTDLIKRECGIIGWNDRGPVRVTRKPVVRYKKRRVSA